MYIAKLQGSGYDDLMDAAESRFPFLFGTQYYRAPTPDPLEWEKDLDAIRGLGFTMVKLFVQWRWSHRAPGRFAWDDLDRLLELCTRRDLGVTLNFLLDVSPVWLYQSWPDAMQVNASGVAVQPYVVGHRSIGGHPGPCYRHPGALAERKLFVEEAVRHFRGAPSLRMWDVWNEPELCFPQRTPDLATMVCYCPHCGDGFRAWLKRKYGALERLNAVWGRWYERWDEVELPRGTGAYVDFIDWREFHLDTMAEEAAWRLEAVRRIDPAHGRYLHVVPNWWFSAVTCADDFAMAKDCEVFAATMNGQPEMFQHVMSAARRKTVYNVESHLNFGQTGMHQRRLGLQDVLRDFLPQIGAGVKGIMFWQYRPELLGAEAPAWGLVRPDGSPRPVTDAVREFWRVLSPNAADLRVSMPAAPLIGLWRSRRNEIFHFCMHGNVASHTAGIGGWIRSLYAASLPHVLINDLMLAGGEIDALKLLVMPSPYYLTQEEADGLDRWVRAGGVLVCEAHLAGYDGTSGRHSTELPGCGLARRWGIRESESTAAVHLRPDPAQFAEAAGLADDVRKALQGAGPAGSRWYPIRLQDGATVLGVDRYAELSGTGIVPLGSFDGVSPCLAKVRVGEGVVFYCGTNIGEAAEKDPAGISALLGMAAAAAGVEPPCRVRPEVPGSVHLDVLEREGTPRYAVVVSSLDRGQAVRLEALGNWVGLYTGTKWTLNGATEVEVPAAFAEIFRIG